MLGILSAAMSSLSSTVNSLSAVTVEDFFNRGVKKLDPKKYMFISKISVIFWGGVNFLINGKYYVVPMAIEEPSVVAAASSAAKLTLATGGFQTSSTEQIMI